MLAVLPYERKGERRGYRNGKRVSMGLGATAIELPRARLTEGGEKKEWQSVLIERYQRRLDRWTVLCWGVTSAERTDGAFGGPFSAVAWRAAL